MQRIGFLAYAGVEELDLVGPWEMATMWRAYAGGPECVVVAERQGALRCAKGLGIVADYDFFNLSTPSTHSSSPEASPPSMK